MPCSPVRRRGPPPPAWVPGRRRVSPTLREALPVADDSGLAYGLGLYKYDLPCGGFVWTHGGGVHGSSSEATSSPDGRHTMVFNANGDWAHIEAVKVLEAEYCGTPPPAQR